MDVNSLLRMCNFRITYENISGVRSPSASMVISSGTPESDAGRIGLHQIFENNPKINFINPDQ